MSVLELSAECRKLWKNAKMPPERIQADSIQTFHIVLEQAWNKTSFYPAYWGQYGIQYRDLKHIRPEDIPCIQKEDIREHFEDIATIPASNDIGGEIHTKKKAFVVHSSGSTGAPIKVLYEKSALTTVEANFFRLSNLGGRNRISWADFPIRNIHAASAGDGCASTVLLTNGLSKYHARSILLNASEPLEDWITKIRNIEPNYLSGYPSCLAMLLELQKDGKIDLHPLKIVTGGEPLKESLKHEMETYFYADVIDFYGCSESLLLGAGSSWYEGMYLFDDMNYTEVDQKGHLIITPLYNPSFPLVRYRLDDLVQGFTRFYRGELPFSHIDKIIGRDEELMWFINANGKPDFLHPLVLDELNVEGLKDYQFVQISESAFRINCVVGSTDSSIEKEICRQIDDMMRSKNLQNLCYEIRFQDKLQMNPRTGKVPFVITSM